MSILLKYSIPRYVTFILITIGLLLSSAAVFGQSDANLFPPKPEPAVYVHDYAGWLSADQKSALEQKLRRYWDSTSTQIVVMIRPDIGDYDKSSYAFELGNRWGIGRKDKNNGVLMLIKTEAPERGIFIATGYGTEGALPDITAGQIIRNVMSPYFRQQQYGEGIDAGVDAIITALSGEFKAEPNQSEMTDGEALAVVGIIFLLFVLFIGFIVWRIRKKGTWYTHSGGPNSRNSRGGGFGGGWWIGGGGFGGGSGWGGGGGGGGGFGDGGSFGGGSFGGGGAGGDW